MCKFCKLFQIIFARFENCLSVQVIFVAEIVGFAKCHSDVFCKLTKQRILLSIRLSHTKNVAGRWLRCRIYCRYLLSLFLRLFGCSSSQHLGHCQPLGGTDVARWRGQFLRVQRILQGLRVACWVNEKTQTIPNSIFNFPLSNIAVQGVPKKVPERIFHVWQLWAPLVSLGTFGQSRHY